MIEFMLRVVHNGRRPFVAGAVFGTDGRRRTCAPILGRAPRELGAFCAWVRMIDAQIEIMP